MQPFAQLEHRAVPPFSAIAAAVLMGLVLLAFTAMSARAATPVPLPSPGTIIFYTAALTTVGAFFLFNVAMNNRIGVYYAALFTAMLALVWFLEGGLASLSLGIGKDLEHSIGLTIGLCGVAFGFFTAERAIDEHIEWPWGRRGLLGLSGLSVVLIAGAWAAPFAAMALIVDILLLLLVVSHLAATLTWKTPDGQRLRLPALAAGALLAAIVGLFLVYYSGGGALTLDTIFRWLFALVVVPAMAAVGTALVDIRRSRDVALEAALVAAQKDAEMSASLLEMEKNYTRARDIAAQRKREISTVSHDIRQPIAAMRAELDSLKGEIAVENTERLDRILDHFDILTKEFSRRDQPGVTVASDEADSAEDVPASLLFSMLNRMFQAEAEAKGIALRFVDSAAVFHAPAVVLMRIAANLVSNAIAHSEAARVLIGVRRRNGSLQLHVFDDGIGFPDADVDAALEAGPKSAASEGAGLGLSIVRELALEQGFALDYGSVAGKGSRFVISVPAAL